MTIFEFPLDSPLDAVELVLDAFEGVFMVRHELDDSEPLDVRRLYSEISENGLAELEYPVSATGIYEPLHDRRIRASP